MNGIPRAILNVKEKEPIPSSTMPEIYQRRLASCMISLGHRKVALSQNFPDVQKKLSNTIHSVQQELSQTGRNCPQDDTPIAQVTLWQENVIRSCIFAKKLEIEMAHMTGEINLNSAGNKHSNLMRMNILVEGLGLADFEVPKPYDVSSEILNGVLYFNQEWKELNELFEKYIAERPKGDFLDRPFVTNLLTNITQKIKKLFNVQIKEQLPIFSKELMSFIDEVHKNNEYLMVRSSGEEDGKVTNAGGNKSCKYVKPEFREFCLAYAEVLASYFSKESLKNLLNVGVNPFKEMPKMGVAVQRLIGEPVIMDEKASFIPAHEIPISLVLFTTEPLYVGGENFRVMRISASYGHGDGVVNGMGIASDTVLMLVSETNPDKIYVLYHNVEKPKRLAPVLVNGKVEVKAIDNPSALKNKPVLNREVLSKLFTWGVIGEKFFGDEATDMEIVIKNGKIYPVQARPINRPSLLPTYLDVKKILLQRESGPLKENPILATVQGEVLVSGTASVVLITKTTELLIANTLEVAEQMYNKNLHKAVVVLNPEPANSHPVVNFSGMGVPCLYAQIGQVRIDPNVSIVLCMQEGTINHWDNKYDITQYISSGFTVHPAKIAISLPFTLSQKTYVRNLTNIPQELSQLLVMIRTSKTHSAALEALTKLKENPYFSYLHKKIKDMQNYVYTQKIVPKQVEETLTVLDHLVKTIDTVFAETEAALKKSTQGEKLRPLFHIKTLQTLITSETTNDGTIGQYSCISSEPYLQDAQDLIDFQKQFNNPVECADIYLIGNAALERTSREIWRDFIIGIEKNFLAGKVTLQKIEDLKEMVRHLESFGLLETWFAFFFSKGQSIDEVLETFPDRDLHKIIHVTNIKQEVYALNQNIKIFSQPINFTSSLKKLENLIERMNIERLDLEDSAPLTRLLVLYVLQDVVEVCDKAIKEMLSCVDLPKREKLVRFKAMLEVNYFLLISLAMGLKPFISLHMHEEWPLTKYLIEMKNFLSRNKIDESDLTPSRSFSVAAAAFGVGTSFSRHFPQNLSDFFTLTHQNNKIILANCIDNILSFQISSPYRPKSQHFSPYLPERLNKICSQILSIHTKNKISKMGIEISRKEINVFYNIVLRNHSAHITLQYNNADQSAMITCKLIGLGRYRWSDYVLMAKCLQKINVISLNRTPYPAPQEVVFHFNVTLQNDVEEIIKIFDWFCSESLEDEDASRKSFVIKYHKYLKEILEICVDEILKDSNLSKVATCMLENLLNQSRGVEQVNEIQSYIKK